MAETKPERRSSHQTQWAAQFAVASELCKRGYEVALTMGNHPTKDLMVSSPNGVNFGIDVKGLYKRNYWTVKKKPDRNDIFYVLAFMPNDEKNRFFVLSQTEANEGLNQESIRAAAAAEKRGVTGYREKFPGISWRFAEKYENFWDKLPK
ncbi:hypothetical protein [Sandaracinobacteroides saxicola]|uniref:DUF4365 domain-containing protein n=1 Tax=Sandaracinobacteroides saxicola TaxID=2759707 RepID=A0A7G5IK79_9SPHN|nr:hypothetical protein [Sandaracinobacteroides saxicola]QMW23771.1 hypothetical protein H3309_04625 [Sandaracinobacteroides saxicola]